MAVEPIVAAARNQVSSNDTLRTVSLRVGGMFCKYVSFFVFFKKKNSRVLDIVP
jgi:hypothetical protein